MRNLSKVLDDVLAGVREDLTDPVARATVSPGGQVAWDDCCSGQLWVRLIGVEPKSSAPGCGVDYARVSLGVGTVRCAHTVDDLGRPPTQRQITSDGHEMVQDVNDIMSSLMQMTSPFDERPFTLNQWIPLGPNGGCHGGEWRVTVDLGVCL